MVDLNNALDNHAITCDCAATAHRRDAANIRAMPKIGWEPQDRANEDKARHHDRTAERYEVRAKYARAGKMATHPFDQADQEGAVYRKQFPELHDHAAAAGRVVALNDDNQPI
jgi:hypothetical protein